jgi:cytochrome c-type biogenesis protein CcmH
VVCADYFVACWIWVDEGPDKAEARDVTLALVLLITLVVGALLWRFGGLSSNARMIAFAGLALGVSGYALQGSPGLPGQPVAPPAVPIPAEGGGDAHSTPRNGLDQMLRAEVFMRAGQTDRGMEVIRTALAKDPNDASVWTGLATVLMSQSNGVLSPAADYSFRKAAVLDPNNMALQYFYGSALATNGRPAEAKEQWLPLLRRLPKGDTRREQLVSLIAESGVLTPDEIKAASTTK